MKLFTEETIFLKSLMVQGFFHRFSHQFFTEFSIDESDTSTDISTNIFTDFPTKFVSDLKHLLIIPGPRLKRKSVQVAPRPGNNWSTACKWHAAIPKLWMRAIRRQMGENITRQISLKKFRICSSVLSDVIQLSAFKMIWGLTDASDRFYP